MTNREKFKQMKPKDKVGYIWEYYRWYILGTIVAVIMVGSFLSAVLGPKPPTYPVDVVVTGLVNIDQEKIDTLKTKFNTELNAEISILPTDWSSATQSAMITEQKLVLMIQVRELDILVASPKKYESYMKIEDFDPFLKLDEVEALRPVLDKYKDNLIISKSKTTGEEHVFGIKVEKLDRLEGMEIGEELIIALIDPPKDMNAAINVINYLLGE